VGGRRQGGGDTQTCRSIVRPQKTVTAIELTTSLSVSTCLARLRAAAASDDWFFLPWPWLNDPMLVRVRGNRFLLMKAAGGPPRNSFRRMFHGQVIEHRGGALIRGRFKMHSFVRFGLVVWFGGLIAVGLLLFSANASRALGMPMKESAPGWLFGGVYLNYLVWYGSRTIRYLVVQ